MTTPIVTAAEIMSMQDLTAYLRVPADVPVCKLKIQYQSRDKMNDGFVKRDRLTDPLIEACVVAVTQTSNRTVTEANSTVQPVNEALAVVADAESTEEVRQGRVTTRPKPTVAIDREI